MVRAAALLLTLLTGFSALVYEVAWQKYLTVLLGSDSEATAAILGIFLGGLSYGYALFGRIARRLAVPGGPSAPPARLLRAYGLVEAGIGAYALFFPLLFQGARALSLWLPQGSETLAFGFDVALTVLLIGPPAVLMGGTIPLLTQALARGLEDATRFHAFVYAFNTLGAFGGALCAAFFLIPWLGLGASVRLMGLANLAAGALFVVLGGRASAPDASAPTATPSEAPEGLRALALAALLAGFAMMSLQTVANRVGALALGASHFTFAMVVAAFVLCIALGSFAVSSFSRIPRSVLPLAAWLMVAYLLILDREIPNAGYWAHVLRAQFSSDASGFYPFHFAVMAALLAVLALPLALSGALLPLIFHHLRRAVSDLGQVAGSIYSWNTVGSLLGALLGGYALFFWLDLHQIYRLAVLVAAAAGAVLTANVLPRGRLLGGGAFALVAAVVLLAAPWDPGRLSAGLFRERELLSAAGKGPDEFFENFPKSHSEFILFHDDDPSMTVVVRDRHARSIINNGKSDSAIPTDNVTMGLAALVPALLAGKAERAFVIGYGTGWTVGVLNAIESMREVVVAEISRGVIDAAPLFDELNGDASTHPKTRIIRSDAYRALSREEGRYDVIVSEPSNPWTAGVELLYTREFLETVRERLAPGGILAQWMHTYETDRETLGIVLRTYRDVFEGVGVWFARGSDLILLGFSDRERPLDLARMEERFARPDFQELFAGHGVRSLPVLLSHELLPVGVLDAAELDFEMHTVLHPILSDRAARAFFEGRVAPVPFTPTPDTARAGAEASLLRRLRAAQGRPPTARERFDVVQEVCRYRLEECAAHIAEWQHEDPGSPELAQLVSTASGSKDHARLVQPELRAMLATFLGDGDVSALEPQAAQTFIEYFNYSAPFDTAVLETLLARCQADPSCASENGSK